jgi:hypothetical protein
MTPLSVLLGRLPEDLHRLSTKCKTKRKNVQ